MSVKIVKVQSGDYKLVVGSVNPQTGIPSLVTSRLTLIQQDR